MNWKENKQRKKKKIELKLTTNSYFLSHLPGRGVFSTRPLPASTVLETSPVLVLPPEEDAIHISHTTLHHYTYNWPLLSSHTPANEPNEPDATAPQRTQAIILGLGSMFNHSHLHQNVGWTRDVAREVVVYRALRDIAAGEELCISYGPPGKLTFHDAEAEAVRRVEEEEERREMESGGGLAGIEL